MFNELTSLLMVEPPSSWAEWALSAGSVFVAVGLVVLCAASWATNLIAMPGNWISIAIAGSTVLIAFILALVGELIEFVAGAFGAQRAGASRRATIYAMLGSIGGAIVGALIGLPVPVVGSVLAAILFGGLGATAGAMYGHWSDGQPWRESWTIGHAAFWGRLCGTLGKIIVGAVMVTLVFGSILLRPL